jgi:hypothetical protein
MLSSIIIGQINKVVKATIEKYSEKYNSEVQLFLSDSGKLDIQVLSAYHPKEHITTADLKIPLVSDQMVEEKILSSLRNFKEDLVLLDPKCLLLIKDEKVVAFLYDGEKPLKQIDISKLI